MSILNNRQINQKVIRLAYEIIEHNSQEKKIYLAGINNNGYAFAKLLLEQIQSVPGCPLTAELIQIHLDPAKPTLSDITIDMPSGSLKNKNVIVVDDVANTGRTIFYAFTPFMSLLLKKLQVAVLVDRKHKNFPINVDYVGLTLATTIEDHIEVNLTQKDTYSVKLK
ncbi:MAG: pyrimidine operon attenuation protein/uracil phosphoribosyltransferase [Saprospiraceae bacterium]|jgi:pyrimidine operon attenuation protein/uracil phosphoribosyltransferase